MTEGDARTWIGENFGVHMIDRLGRFEALLIEEMTRQNLIARSTIQHFWTRHLADSAQLIALAGDKRSTWIDVGTGAGMPGMVVAVLWPGEVIMVEPRRLRAAFLERCVSELALNNARVCQSSAEKVQLHYSAEVISARAVGTLGHVLDITAHLADERTRFVLPKGTRARSEIAATRPEWHGEFHVEQSLIDPDSSIIVAEGVSRR